MLSRLLPTLLGSGAADSSILPMMENTLANVDLGRYRRIVQIFWDPEPANDVAADQAVWCLGRSYQISRHTDHANPESMASASTSEGQSHSGAEKSVGTWPSNTPKTPPESIPSSFSSSLAYDESGQDGGWPQGFIDDFEARFWMTYRSEFDPIRRSSDPKASSAMSLSMRIKTQLGDQTGFSSDSGWGCMIRSGQSLLANAIALLRLGRGKCVISQSVRYSRVFRALRLRS